MRPIDNTNQPKRSSDLGWSVIGSGENGIDLLQYVIDVADFDEAARIGTEVAALVAKNGREDPVVYTQITLRAWQVAITLTAPLGEWASLSQQELARTLNAHHG